ncbi:MAG: ribosome biogenesis GTP-binding protein YihA/YsxC [Syntrophomonas sp.]
MLIIKSAEFKGVYIDLNQLPEDGFPEFALVGRSNVGKSSLINKFTNRKKLAKSSSTPGKTRTINYYLINQKWYLVDLPGYGYAKVSKSEKAKWSKMVEQYLSQRRQLRGVIQLLDIRHPPGENDVLMKNWLMDHQIPILVVATKLDKISRSARGKQTAIIRKAFEMQPGEMPLYFSAETGEGVEALKEALQEMLEEEK